MRELQEFYEPNKVLHREEELNIISNLFEDFQTNGYSTKNLAILGKTGSGKSLVINKIKKKYDNYLYASASITRTTLKTMKSLFNCVYTEEYKILTTGIEYLKIHPKIIIVNEVNKIPDIKHFFDNINTIFRETGCPIILISNKEWILMQMPEDARLTLFFDIIPFKPYNSDELYDIIKDRKIPDNIPEEALRHICGVGASKGSARIVLKITSECITKKDYSFETIEEEVKKLEKEDWFSYTNSLNLMEKKIYSDILEMSNQDYITPLQLKNKSIGLSSSRISQFIYKFEHDGLINVDWFNKGVAGGRYRLLTINQPEIVPMLKAILKEIA